MENHCGPTKPQYITGMVMVPVKEDVIERRYFKFTAIAKEMGIPSSRLRFWAKKAFGIALHKNRSNEISVDAETAAKLWEIYRLMVIEQYTINGAKRQLEKCRDTDH